MGSSVGVGMGVGMGVGVGVGSAVAMGVGSTVGWAVCTGEGWEHEANDSDRIKLAAYKANGLLMVLFKALSSLRCLNGAALWCLTKLLLL